MTLICNEMKSDLYRLFEKLNVPEMLTTYKKLKVNGIETF